MISKAADEDGRLQVAAAIALLESSRLVSWNATHWLFKEVAQNTFENGLDTAPFERLICWIKFSTGAEFLLKGLCLLLGIEIRDRRKGKNKGPVTPKDVYEYPPEDLSTWIAEFARDPQSPQFNKAKGTDFGTLGDLLPRPTTWKESRDCPLKKLCAAAGAKDRESDRLFAAYEFLRGAIRNRDAHAYVRDVRGAHFNLVSELYVEAFNLLISWLPACEKEKVLVLLHGTSATLT